MPKLRHVDGLFWLAIAAAALAVAPTLAAGGGKADPPIPDFTKGDKRLKNSHDWTLGPTGARGWIYAARRETTQSRQVYVTEVTPGAPADGVLARGDAILGVDGKAFDSDARIALAKAIGAAEATDGQLRLLCWREGAQRDAVIRLKPLGEYSDTAPYDCPKSLAIFDAGCRALAAEMQNPRRRQNRIVRSLDAMALLASGEEAYLPLVRQEARRSANTKVKPVESFQSWYYGYVNLFLCEYYLATGDASVLPGIKRLALAIAEGQSAVGSWGHKFANPETRILHGYGAMNAPALSLTMSLVLAREAGIESSKIDRAIEKSARFLRFYSGKGSIPYGDHHPWMETYDPNGKCAAAAVMFDLIGDAEATRFFSKMTTAAHGLERDTGHTGNYLTQVWALPGVSRSGPHATGAWLKEAGWRFDLARRWDGRFIYQGEPGVSSRTGDHVYAGWDCTSAYLLNYAVGRRSLRITGRKPSVAPELTEAEAAAVIADGKDWGPANKAEAYKDRGADALLDGLESWSPIVRSRCATALRKRKDPRVMDVVMDLLEHGDSESRLGACEALESMGRRATPAIPLLVRTLKADDAWLRVQAGEALAAIGKPALVAAPELLAIAADVDDTDPRQMTQRYVAFLLFEKKKQGNFKGLLADSLRGIDPGLLYDATRAVLQNQDGRARGAVDSVYANLTYEEIEPLLPAIYESIAEPAPSGVMFSGRVRLAGLKLFAKHKIAEGIPLSLVAMDHDKWGKAYRIRECLKVLESYGAAAKSQLTELRGIEQELRSMGRTEAKHADAVRDAIKKIERAEQAPELRQLPPAERSA
ncbi:MAG: DUF6288 domain-containing protein [Planctomycetota bacterium]